ncbi:MAG: hypothetical protein AB7O44_27550 [Hyphomicrobiaceae bacterium]
MAEQPALLPEARLPEAVIQRDDWNALQRRVHYPNMLAALIWTYQDGYRRAMRDIHEDMLARRAPQPPEEK